MLVANKTHIVLLVLYALVVFMAVYGVVSNTSDTNHLPIAVWAALGTVGASGAMLEILVHLRTRNSLNQMKDQIRRMGKCGQVGLVMLEDQWPVEGLAGILNEYLILIQGKMDKLTRERKELDLLVGAVDAEKHNTEAIVWNISDAVLVANSFGELTLANRLAEDLFGFELPKSLNRPIEEVLSDTRLVDLLRPGRWKENDPVRFEYNLIPAGGKDRKYFIVSVVPVFIRTQELWAVAMTLHDVTREHEVEQLKSDFVNQVSHELRTPLSSIKAYIELLLDGDIKTASGRTEFYQIIKGESERLDRFIENMLNLSRIESGLLAVEPVPVDVSEELRQSVDLVRYVAKEKSIEIDLSGVPAELRVWADRDLVRQVILNLLSNAIKYTPSQGRVTLSAGWESEGTYGWFAVQDTGIGIAAEDRDKIFDKFYRSGGKEMSGGTGLGLALVKKVVEQIHNGRVEVESVPGTGSKFIVRLPLSRPTASEPGPTQEEAATV